MATGCIARRDQAFIEAITLPLDDEEGRVWTVAVGTGYPGKPGPAVIVQGDRFDATDSVTICAITTEPTDAPLIRLAVEPDGGNRLRSTSGLMVDKLTTAPRGRLGVRLGALSSEDLVRLERAIVVFLGLTGRPAS